MRIILTAYLLALISPTYASQWLRRHYVATL